MNRYEKWSNDSQPNDTNNSYTWSALKLPKAFHSLLLLPCFGHLPHVIYQPESETRPSPDEESNITDQRLRR